MAPGSLNVFGLGKVYKPFDNRILWIMSPFFCLIVHYLEVPFGAKCTF